MEVILLRHAQTAGNLERRYVGITNEPLCREGIKSAVKSGIVPFVPLVYSSPMIRAVQTATIKFPNARIITVPGLREMDFGLFEGRTADEMSDDLLYQTWVEGECKGPCPKGESREGFAARTCVAFSEVVGESISRRHSYLIIVAHGGTIMSVMERFASPGRAYWEWHVGNCDGFKMQLDEESWPYKPQLSYVEKL